MEIGSRIQRITLLNLKSKKLFNYLKHFDEPTRNFRPSSKQNILIIAELNLNILDYFLAVLFPVSNLVIRPRNAGAIVGPMPATVEWSNVAGILEEECVVCHVSGADLPFYAGFPIAKGIIQADISEGLKFLDMLETIKINIYQR